VCRNGFRDKGSRFKVQSLGFKSLSRDAGIKVQGSRFKD